VFAQTVAQGEVLPKQSFQLQGVGSQEEPAAIGGKNHKRAIKRNQAKLVTGKTPFYNERL